MFHAIKLKIWKLPQNGGKKKAREKNKVLKRLSEAVALARSVYKSIDLLKSKTTTFKKSQSNLQNVLQGIFPNNGNEITANSKICRNVAWL